MFDNEKMLKQVIIPSSYYIYLYDIDEYETKINNDTAYTLLKCVICVICVINYHIAYEISMSLF
jgi:hypothetical protein